MLKTPVRPGSVALLPLTGIPPDQVPAGSVQAKLPDAARRARSRGVVWRDFKPGGGTPGKLEKGEVGLAERDGRAARLVRQDDLESTKTGDRRRLRLHRRQGGRPTSTAIGIGHVQTALRRRLMARLEAHHPSIMIAYIWVWAGFAMVVIGAGLAAIPRDVLEAARTDGSTEWQVFRRVTVPLLAPGAERRLHHDADQRAEGLRHRAVGRAGLGAGATPT